MTRLLVIRFSALGDVAMTVPVLESLIREYPGVQITVVSRGAFQPLFAALPADRVTFFAADLKGVHRGIGGIRRLFGELKTTRFNGVADLHGVLRSRLLATFFRLSGVEVTTINKGRKEKRALTRWRRKVRKPLPTSFERYRAVFEKLGYSFPFSFVSLFEGKTPDTQQLEPLIGCKYAGERWIGIAPFAKHAGKIYPLDKMEEVVRLLADHSGIRLFFFGGGPEETRLLVQWEQQFAGSCSLPGRLNMIQELLLMTQLNAMLSMDSANMHLASLVATPVVSVWGATHPAAGFMGWGQCPQRAIQSELACRPCSVFGDKPCRRGDYACLNSLSPERIAEAVLQTIGYDKTCHSS